MLQRPDHLELLAFIEDELDAVTAAQVRKRLAGEPRVLEAIERMQQDRATLRTLGDVHVPTDVLDQLEALLARPMLAEPLESMNGTAAGRAASYAAPGQFRRQHRRQMLRIRWRRIAVAAVVLMAVMAGVWAAVNGLRTRQSSSLDHTLASSGQPNRQALSPDVVAVDELPGTIHHALSRLHQNPPLIASAGESSRSFASLSSATTPIVAEFALVVRADDAVQAEQALASIAGEMNDAVALVRNFSFAEATRIAQELQRANNARREPNQPPIVASVADDRAPSTTQLKSLAESVRQQTRIKRSTAQTDAVEASGQISGPSQIAPSLEQQLAFSSRGASHSIAVPVARLKSFLEKAAINTDQATSLRMLNSEVESQSDDSLSTWVMERQRLQQAFNGLKGAPRDAIVLIPVIVQNN